MASLESACLRERVRMLVGIQYFYVRDTSANNTSTHGP